MKKILMSVLISLLLLLLCSCDVPKEAAHTALLDIPADTEAETSTIDELSVLDTNTDNETDSSKVNESISQEKTVLVQNTDDSETENSEIADSEIEPSVVYAESITIQAPDLNLERTKTAQLSVLFIPENTSDQTIIWTSSDESILVVNEDGEITAMQVGTAVITAETLNGVQAEVEISVLPIQVTGLQIVKTQATIVAGDDFQLSVNIFPEDAEDRAITWSSEDETLLSIDSEGFATAISQGVVTVHATASNGVSASLDIKIEGRMLTFALYPDFEVTDSNHVGNDWEISGFTVNDSPIAYGGTFTVQEGDTITVTMIVMETEKDASHNDVGKISLEIVVPYVDVGRGFNREETIEVREDSGRYAGNLATVLCICNFKRVE